MHNCRRTGWLGFPHEPGRVDAAPIFPVNDSTPGGWLAWTKRNCSWHSECTTEPLPRASKKKKSLLEYGTSDASIDSRNELSHSLKIHCIGGRQYGQGPHSARLRSIISWRWQRGQCLNVSRCSTRGVKKYRCWKNDPSCRTLYGPWWTHTRHPGAHRGRSSSYWQRSGETSRTRCSTSTAS